MMIAYLMHDEQKWHVDEQTPMGNAIAKHGPFDTEREANLFIASHTFQPMGMIG